MKRYLLFYSTDFYPAMGMNDCQGDFDSIKQCHDKIKHISYRPDRFAYQIFDLKKRVLVFQNHVDIITSDENRKTMNNDLYNGDWINIDGNSIHKTAIIHPNVKLGTGNTIGAYCVIGSNGEIRGVSQNEFQGTVHIGNGNVISEHVTIQRPFPKGESTIIGNDNLIMAHVHVGHDVYIGNGCEICTSSVIGGYVTVYDKAKIKLHCVVRNRLIIGSEAVIGMGSVVTKNVPNFTLSYGNPARIIVGTKFLDNNEKDDQ